MSAQSAPLDDLLPEIFPVVASLLPLHATPSTLLSLALVNRHISNIVLPLVYSRLILKNENDALKIIQKLLDEPELGKVVRELHILSDLSLATRTGENPFDVVRGLEKVIAAGSLPYIHTLGLHLLSGWHHDDKYQLVEGFGQLRSEFWTELRKNCPRLRGLVLWNIGDLEDDPWVDESGLLEIRDVTSLTLYFEGFSLSKEGADKLLKNITSLCGSLHTLDLTPSSPDWVPAAPLFSLHFPHLRSLSLASFTLNDADEAMIFWQKHSSLEHLKIITSDDKTRWFKNELPSNFLPNLKHLKARFSDVRILAPILNQLVGLTVYNSVNAQVPYLLRAVLPEGLPNLKSLNIGQLPSATSKNANTEGSLWYETEDGRFMTVKKVYQASRRVSDGYMHSIVRGAPNLEEIGLSSHIPEFEKIASDIAGLSKLRRFYHTGRNKSLFNITDEERESFISNAQILAEACSELTTVVDTSSDYPPFVAARIRRDEVGEVVNIGLGTSYGMHIGNDDEAFPLSQPIHL